MLYPFPASFVAQALVSGVYQATLIPPLGYSIESVAPASVDKFWVQQVEYTNGSVVIYGEAEQPAWLQSLTLIAVADGPGGVKRYNPRVTISEGTWPLVTPQVVWIGVRVKNPSLTDWVFPYVPSGVLWQEPGSLVVGADALPAPTGFGIYGSSAMIDPSLLSGYADNAEVTGPIMNTSDSTGLKAFTPYNYPNALVGAGFVYKASLLNGKPGLKLGGSANYNVYAIESLVANPIVRANPLWSASEVNSRWHFMMVMNAFPYLYGEAHFFDAVTSAHLFAQYQNKIMYYDWQSVHAMSEGPTIHLAPCILEWQRDSVTGRFKTFVNGVVVSDIAASPKDLNNEYLHFHFDGGYAQGEFALFMGWHGSKVVTANINAARAAAATRFGITLP